MPDFVIWASFGHELVVDCLITGIARHVDIVDIIIVIYADVSSRSNDSAAAGDKYLLLIGCVGVHNFTKTIT